MALKKIEVKIKGKTPLIMHKFPMVEIEALEKKDPKEQAEIAAYRNENTKELYIPGINIQRALIAGATYSKGKGRASLQKQAAASLIIEPEYVGLGTDIYEIDSRPVVVPATRGRIIRHRPRLDKWGCTFLLQYEDTLLNEAQVRKIVDDTLERVGLLDFRPEKKGPFGRAFVVSWKAIKK
jgi:hypothetical protein